MPMSHPRDTKNKMNCAKWLVQLYEWIKNFYHFNFMQNIHFYLNICGYKAGQGTDKIFHIEHFCLVFFVSLLVFYERVDDLCQH